MPVRGSDSLGGLHPVIMRQHVPGRGFSIRGYVIVSRQYTITETTPVSGRHNGCWRA